MQQPGPITSRANRGSREAAPGSANAGHELEPSALTRALERRISM